MGGDVVALAAAGSLLAVVYAAVRCFLTVARLVCVCVRVRVFDLRQWLIMIV
jgi:hypothetical protein